MNDRAAAVIPAFNEVQTIGQVVRALRRCALLSEVVVVSDGSSDGTAEAARSAGATVYDLPRNAGKGAALLYGAARTDAPILAFFDADLIGLTADHVERLLLPVLSGSRAMNVGIRHRGPFFSRIAAHLPLVSGVRALRREIVEGVPPEFMRGYMVDTALNYFCHAHAVPCGTVSISGIRVRRKPQKVGWRRGVVQYLRATGEVTEAMLAVRVARVLGRFGG